MPCSGRGGREGGQASVTGARQGRGGSFSFHLAAWGLYCCNLCIPPPGCCPALLSSLRTHQHDAHAQHPASKHPPAVTRRSPQPPVRCARPARRKNTPQRSAASLYINAACALCFALSLVQLPALSAWFYVFACHSWLTRSIPRSQSHTSESAAPCIHGHATRRRRSCGRRCRRCWTQHRPAVTCPR